VLKGNYPIEWTGPLYLKWWKTNLLIFI
jgi:hypothetical protein